jgi:hypothetical protein
MIYRGRKRIRQHRLVMEEILGRSLLPEETVHHKNGVRHDNRPENLELWSESQPAGQRVEDKLAWALQIISLYGQQAGGARGCSLVVMATEYEKNGVTKTANTKAQEVKLKFDGYRKVRPAPAPEPDAELDQAVNDAFDADLQDAVGSDETKPADAELDKAAETKAADPKAYLAAQKRKSD